MNVRSLFHAATVLSVVFLVPGAGVDAAPCAGPQDIPAEKAAPMQWARVQSTEAQLRCFASDRSPMFEDRLQNGTIVRVGPAEGLFRPVELPLGPLGYVHKSFASDLTFEGDDAGYIKTTGVDVSFRYRPKDGEAPVARLPKDAKLHWIGANGDWWQVRAPGQVGYLSASDIEILEGADSTAEASYTQWSGSVRSQWQEAVAKETSSLVQRQQEDSFTTRLDQVALELARPKDQRNLAQLSTETTTLLAEIPAESPVRQRAQQLAKAVLFQQKLIEVIEATPPPPTTTHDHLIQPTPKGALERFTSVGWLTFQPSQHGLSRFQLRKGGVILAQLVAAKGRYDLGLFDGYEVGINGNYNLPQSSGVRTLEVERLEIIARPMNR